jgi:hypothetical protein
MWKWCLVAVAVLGLVAAPLLLSAPAPPEPAAQAWKLPLTKGQQYDFNFGPTNFVGEVLEFPSADWVRIGYQVGEHDGERFTKVPQECWVNLRSVYTVRLLKAE